jgi:hypothetical protein
MMDEKTVLLVYNNYNKVKKFVNALHENNYRLEMYSDPHLALIDYIPNYFDLFLFEVRLSKMSGFDLYFIINKIEHVPACFITILASYYRSLMNIYPNVDVTCFISPTLSPNAFIKTIQEKLCE